MDQTTFFWVVSASIPPMIGWAVYVQVTLSKVLSHVEKSDDFAKVIDRNTDAIKSLTHVVKYIEETNGARIPPEIKEVD